MKSKSTEVALANPNVNNTINMSLNQNDMIDVVIEHQLEIIIAQLEENTKLLEANKKALTDLTAATKVQLKAKFTKENSELVAFRKIIKQLKLEIQDESTLNVDSCNYIKFEACADLDLDVLESYKDPYTYAKRNPRTIELKFIPFTALYIKYIATSGGLHIMYQSDKIYIKMEDQKEYTQKGTALLKARIILQNIGGKLIMSYLEYRYGEKRIKAKIIKASLKKSDEGRGILAMLEGATNIKLLS